MRKILIFLVFIESAAFASDSQYKSYVRENSKSLATIQKNADQKASNQTAFKDQKAYTCAQDPKIGPLVQSQFRGAQKSVPARSWMPQTKIKRGF